MEPDSSQRVRPDSGFAPLRGGNSSTHPAAIQVQLDKNARSSARDWMDAHISESLYARQIQVCVLRAMRWNTEEYIRFASCAGSDVGIL